MDEYRLELLQIATAIDLANESGYYPRNPGACSAYGRQCDFFGVCCGEEQLESGLDSGRFEDMEDLNPELSQKENQ